MYSKTLRISTALAALVLWSTAASADTREKRCAGFAAITASFADNHQSGVPLAKVLESLDVTVPEVILNEVFKKLAVMVYDNPRYQGDHYQQQFINEWRDRVHVTCLRERW